MNTTTNPDIISTTCPTCGMVRELHIDSLPGIEANDFLCSDCRNDRDRSQNGWTPENSLN